MYTDWLGLACCGKLYTGYLKGYIAMDCCRIGALPWKLIRAYIVITHSRILSHFCIRQLHPVAYENTSDHSIPGKETFVAVSRDTLSKGWREIAVWEWGRKKNNTFKVCLSCCNFRIIPRTITEQVFHLTLNSFTTDLRSPNETVFPTSRQHSKGNLFHKCLAGCWYLYQFNSI